MWGSGAYRTNNISIHAPVKGATYQFHAYGLLSHISIHAPVKGATRVDVGFLHELAISIHAPVKGATKPHGEPKTEETDFNPRSRKGSDPDRKYSLSPWMIFQSTLP